MLQPDLHFGIGIPTFWEENQVMKTNMYTTKELLHMTETFD